MKNKNDGTSIKDIVDGITSSARNLYKKKITIPSLDDTRKGFIKLTGGISDENREQIHKITCLFKGQDVMPNNKYITPWLCGYVSAFSYLLFTYIDKIEEFEKKLKIMILIYSGVFIISESRAKSLFGDVSEQFLENEEYIDGSFAAESDFNAVIISRKITYLKKWVQYIEKGTYLPKKGPGKSINETLKQLLNAESKVKEIISTHLFGSEVKEIEDDFKIEKKYRKEIGEALEKEYTVKLINKLNYYTVGDAIECVTEELSRSCEAYYIGDKLDL